jgi:hypothetical protein
MLLVADFLAWRSGFIPTALRVGFMVDKLVLELVFLLIHQFSPVSIIPSLVHVQWCITWELALWRSSFTGTGALTHRDTKTLRWAAPEYRMRLLC